MSSLEGAITTSNWVGAATSSAGNDVFRWSRRRLLVLCRRLRGGGSVAFGEREREGLALRRRSCGTPRNEQDGSLKLRDGLRDDSAEGARRDVDRCRRRPRHVAESPDNVFDDATTTSGPGLRLRLRPLCISGSGDNIAPVPARSSGPMVASVLVAMFVAAKRCTRKFVPVGRLRRYSCLSQPGTDVIELLDGIKRPSFRLRGEGEIEKLELLLDRKHRAGGCPFK